MCKSALQLAHKYKIILHLYYVLQKILNIKNIIDIIGNNKLRRRNCYVKIKRIMEYKCR